jgi:hypothetical protein
MAADTFKDRLAALHYNADLCKFDGKVLQVLRSADASIRLVGYLSFEGLDPWVRPAAQIVWLLSTVHFFIQCLLFLGRAIRVVGAWLNGIPQRRRKAAFERPLIQRLRDIDGLSREMLCYALYKNDNHFWVSDDNARRAWLQRLRVAGLINVDDANFRTVHYKIHPIAWAYMKLYPNQFINLVLWPKEPWIIADGREVEADAIVEKQVAGNSRKTWWRFPGAAAATAIKLRKHMILL